jgi:hypothetical protein
MNSMIKQIITFGMKKLILFSALLFSFNGWAEDENPFNAWSEDVEYPILVTRGNYDGSIVCFSDGTRTHTLTNVNILHEDLDGIEMSLSYQSKNKRHGYLTWNSRSSTSCNITWNTDKEVCIKKDDSETNMKNCKK